MLVGTTRHPFRYCSRCVHPIDRAETLRHVFWIVAEEASIVVVLLARSPVTISRYGAETL